MQTPEQKESQTVLNPMPVIIAGASGRMGCWLTRHISQRGDMRIIGALSTRQSDFLGQDIGEVAGISPMGIEIAQDADQILSSLPDQLNNNPRRLGLIDFSLAPAALDLAPFAARHEAVYVVGTTAHSRASQEAIEKAAKETSVIQSSNMSLALTVLSNLVRQATEFLGEDWDISITERHHNQKRDKPSGTAKMLKEMIKAGQTGQVRQDKEDKEIEIFSPRGSNIPCEHEIYFEGKDERVLLGHYVRSREIFAKGAADVCLWGEDKPSGLYDMQDYIGIKRR